MLPFVLYLAAGLLSGFHIYTLLMLAVYGVPADAREAVAFLGSILLFGAACIALFRPRIAAKIALPACLLSWCFYAPAIRATTATGHSSTLSTLTLIPYFAIAFLLVATVYAGIVSFAGEPRLKIKWLFPQSSPRRVRIALAVSTVAVVLASGAWMVASAHRTSRISSRFMIPDGYVGWLRVEYGVRGAPPLPMDAKQYILQFAADGVLKTSTPEHFGWAEDHYFYYSGSGLRELSASGDQSTRMIWGQLNGEDHSSSGTRTYEEFFVGKQQQFQRDSPGAN